MTDNFAARRRAARKRACILLISTSAWSLLGGYAAHATAADAAGITATADVATGDVGGEILVSGKRPIAESEAAALKVQKESPALVSVVAADEDAAKDAESTQYAVLFADFARDRSQVATELQAQVRTLGGEPETDSSFLAAAHRTFMDLKQALTGKDDKAIIQEVERGEDHIKARYETALKEGDLSPATIAAITKGFASVREGHDRMSALKHSVA